MVKSLKNQFVLNAKKGTDGDTVTNEEKNKQFEHWLNWDISILGPGGAQDDIRTRAFSLKQRINMIEYLHDVAKMKQGRAEDCTRKYIKAYEDLLKETKKNEPKRNSK